MSEATGRTFSVEEALEILREAFSPLDCVAQSKGLGREIAFEVSDGPRTLWKKQMALHLASKDYNLRRLIMDARNSIKGAGLKLDPWEMPQGG